jgi:UDP-glucose 6-dehydrogenase
LTVLDIDNAGVDFISKGKSNEVDAEIEQYLDKKALNLKATLDAS